MTGLRFEPRLLLLSADAGLVRRQLGDAGQAGEQLPLGAALPLRDDISTDEIIPLPAMVHADATLGRHPYTGFQTQGQRPIGVDAVRQAGITVVVAGERYGKGSSRQHSVVAELAARVRLVIAHSFERIYRQNADNVGLLTSTDMGLVARIRAGEAIELDELLQGRDALAAAIVRAGGLLAYGRKDGRAQLQQLAPADSGDTAAAPRTLFEKIVQRHALGHALQPGQGGFVRADWRFIHEYYTGMCAHLLDQAFGADLQLHQPDSIVTFEDHLSYVHRSPAHVQQGLVGGVLKLSRAHRNFAARHGLLAHGYLQQLEAGDPGNTGSEGISHAVMAERYALPGQLIVGTDSHTPHSGALGCVAYGVGTTDMASAFVTGAVRMVMPQVLRIDCNGLLPAGVTAKDIVLHLLALPALRAGAGVGKVFEFAGPVVRALSIDERATLTNMTAEMGGFTGIVAPDEVTVRDLQERRGLHFEIEPWMHSDADAAYALRIAVDCSALSPMVARPGDPGKGVPLAQLQQDVTITIAYGGSCTAGKRADFDQYHAVLAWPAQRGLRVPAHVKLYLQFGTADVRDDCVARGYTAAFDAVGAELLQPACGACANCGPGASSDASEVTVSAINRNFPGRSGPGQVWLASPATVAASALLGRLGAFDTLQREHAAATVQVER